MLNDRWKKKYFRFQSFILAKVIHSILFLLFKTCRIELVGLDNFLSIAGKKKCILMLWHNRLAPILFILAKYTPSTLRYIAVVSGSRDGDMLGNIIRSYRNGNTLRVPHLSRYDALRNLVKEVNDPTQVIAITPDGPRGPCYKVKPGIALAALETGAHVVPFTWEANSYWELKTWDKFRLPKPFTTIHASFYPSISFDPTSQTPLEEAKAVLQSSICEKELSER